MKKDLSKRLKYLRDTIRNKNEKDLRRYNKKSLKNFRRVNPYLDEILSKNELLNADYITRRNLYLKCAEFEIETADEKEKVRRLKEIQQGIGGYNNILVGILISVFSSVIAVNFSDYINILMEFESITMNYVILILSIIVGVSVGFILLQFSYMIYEIIKNKFLFFDYFNTNDDEIKIIEKSLGFNDKNSFNRKYIHRLGGHNANRKIKRG